MHFTTNKCRQTIVEVQLSYRVNQDTRQTRERKIYCQAKKVKMQTTARSKRQSSGCLKGEQLPKWTREPPRHLFFCLNCSTLIKRRVFFLMPHIHYSKFRAESRNMHFHMEANLPIFPRAWQFSCWWFGGRWRW